MEDEKDWMVKRPAGATEEPEKKDSGDGTVAPEALEEAPRAAEGESPADLLARYQKLQAEKEELHDRLLRKHAEFENLRKRLQREKQDFLEHANSDLVRSILPVLDGFERALKHRDGSVPEHFYRGMELIHCQLLDALSRVGLTAVETAGKIFDPYVHQAVESVEAPGYRDQEIVEEVQRGYKLKDRLLRPAIVKVAVRSREQSPGGKGKQPGEKTKSD